MKLLADFALVFIILVLYVPDSEAWWFRRPRTCSIRHGGGNPYYFGTTSLWCITKRFKRGAAPSRGTWSLTHRWIYYDGLFFERLMKDEVYGEEPFHDPNCTWSKESRPAGYSRLSVDCIKNCTMKYRTEYGGYNLLINNCHHFANVMSHILCNYKTCPTWC